MTCAFGRREGRRSCVCPLAARVDGVPRAPPGCAPGRRAGELASDGRGGGPPYARAGEPLSQAAGAHGTAGGAVAGARRAGEQRRPRIPAKSCQLTPAAVPPTTRGPSRGPASCDLPWYSRHGYFTLTRVATQLFAKLASKADVVRARALPRRPPKPTRLRSVDASETRRRGGPGFQGVFKH